MHENKRDNETKMINEMHTPLVRYEPKLYG